MNKKQSRLIGPVSLASSDALYPGDELATALITRSRNLETQGDWTIEIRRLCDGGARCFPESHDYDGFDRVARVFLDHGELLYALSDNANDPYPPYRRNGVARLFGFQRFRDGNTLMWEPRKRRP